MASLRLDELGAGQVLLLGQVLLWSTGTAQSTAACSYSLHAGTVKGSILCKSTVACMPPNERPTFS